jgi:hypothetical protein
MRFVQINLQQEGDGARAAFAVADGVETVAVAGDETEFVRRRAV